MKIKKYLSMATVALAGSLAISSCSDKEYYTEGQMNGAAVSTVSRNGQTFSIAPGEAIPDPVFTLTLQRGTTEGAETVRLDTKLYNPNAVVDPEASSAVQLDQQYSLPDTDNLWTVPTSVTFAAGESTVTFPVKFNGSNTTLATYKMRVKVVDATIALNGQTDWICSVSVEEIPDPVWKAIPGQGVYNCAYFTGSDGKAWRTGVSIERDEAEYRPEHMGYYGHYRIVDPLGWEEGYEHQYLEFYVIPPGNNYPGTSKEEYVCDDYYTWIVPFDTEIVNSNYGANVWFISPTFPDGADWKSFDFFTSLSTIPGEMVIGWITEPESIDDIIAAGEDPMNAEVRKRVQGEPGAVSLAPMVYMFDIGGWNETGDADGYKVAFPGYSLEDYSFDLSLGSLTDGSGQFNINVDVIFEGKDTSYAWVGMFKTPYEPDALDAILDNLPKKANQTEVEVEDLGTMYKLANPGQGKYGTARFPVDEYTFYTIAAVSFDANGNSQDYLLYSFNLGGTPELPDESQWKSLGTGIYRDNLMAGFYLDLEPQVYEVEVQESKAESGLYRIVRPYSASVYPYDLESRFGLMTVDQAMVIDARNPQCVKVPLYYLGNMPDNTQSNCLEFCSASWYYSAVGGFSDENIIALGVNGVLEEGFISFPAPFVTDEGEENSFFGFVNGKLYPANTAGAFALMLPDDEGANAKPRLVITKKADASKVSMISKDKLPVAKAPAIVYSSKPIVKKGRVQNANIGSKQLETLK